MRMFEFLYLGNLMEEKGILVLLEACELLRKRGKSFLCHFVGADKDITLLELKQLRHQRGLDEQVLLHGPMYGADKAAMLKQADALVFPTYYHNECFPFVILEAMQHALPVISTEEGAIPDMVQDGKTGLLVERHNLEVLADAMEYVLKNPDRAVEMGRAGRAVYEAQFTAERFIGNICNVLRKQ